MDHELTCKELVELVTDYLEGALTDEARQQVENHLTGCSGCRNYLEQMRITIRMTGQLSEANLLPQQRDDLLQIFRDWKKS